MRPSLDLGLSSDSATTGLFVVPSLLNRGPPGGPRMLIASDARSTMERVCCPEAKDGRARGRGDVHPRYQQLSAGTAVAGSFGQDVGRPTGDPAVPEPGVPRGDLAAESPR